MPTPTRTELRHLFNALEETPSDWGLIERWKPEEFDLLNSCTAPYDAPPASTKPPRQRKRKPTTQRNLRHG